MKENFNITIRGLIIGCLCLFFISLSACTRKDNARTDTVNATGSETMGSPATDGTGTNAGTTASDSTNLNNRKSDGTTATDDRTVFVEKMEFDKNSAGLSLQQKQAVESRLIAAGPVNEVQVFVWVGGAGNSKDVKLANDRAETMRKYLAQDLKVATVKVTNLTVNPSVREWDPQGLLLSIANR